MKLQHLECEKSQRVSWLLSWLCGRSNEAQNCT